MKKLLLLAVMAMFCLSSNYAQSPITMVKKGGGYQFYQNNQTLKLHQLVSIMQSDPEASIEIKKANSSHSLSMVLGFVGGFMIGWPIGTAMGGGDPEWALAGIGAGLVVISIPITQKAKKHAKNAVDIYNGGLSTHSTSNNLELNCSFTGNGIGLVLNF